MSLFVDKKYESLDWVSQAVQPIDSVVNQLLSEVPDEVVLSLSNIQECMSSYGNSTSIGVTVGTILRGISTPFKKNLRALSWKENSLFEKCFSLSCEPNTVIDLQNNTIAGKITLNKIKFSLTEDDLKSLLGSRGIDAVCYVRGYGNDDKRALVERANEMLLLLGENMKDINTTKSNSYKTRLPLLAKALTNLFKEDRWVIRDGELADKIGFWIADYVEKGTISALANLTTLKVMTHNGLPIYSIKEVQ
jgi:hypothetical protein